MTSAKFDMKDQTILENYLSLSRGDRASVYRKLSVADRMRLDRFVKQSKAKKKTSLKERKVASTKISRAFGEQSPWLEAHLIKLISGRDSDIGEKTLAYIKALPSQVRRIDV